MSLTKLLCLISSLTYHGSTLLPAQRRGGLRIRNGDQSQREESRVLFLEFPEFFIEGVSKSLE